MTETHNSKVIEQLEAMRVKGEIIEKVRDHLTIHKPRTSQLYLLPKIHKNVLPVPGSPIVSANDGPTEWVSAFLDHFLVPIVRTSKSYIQDTSDLLDLLYVNNMGVVSCNGCDRKQSQCQRTYLRQIKSEIIRTLRGYNVDYSRYCLTVAL